MKKNNPVLSDIVQTQKPVIKSQSLNKDWLFSFKEFNQVRNFGLSTTDGKWSASLFDRLRDLSKISIDALNRNTVLQDRLRYHAIDWDAKNIPITRKELDWVNKDVIENETEFTFFQFHISKALGRVIGYWQLNVFNIVLLDPMHNMQPSFYNSYKIRESHTVESDLSNYIMQIDTIKKLSCANAGCIIKEKLMNVDLGKTDSNAVIFFLDDEFLIYLKSILLTNSLSQIIEAGILNKLT